MGERSTQHATFVVDRTFSATPAQLFRAWADPAAKARWFKGPDDWVKTAHELEFTVGGRERLSGGRAGGPTFRYEARYQDIVPDRRIVYAYDMHQDDRRISVSLATVELKPTAGGTRLVYTEQAVFLDGLDAPAAREQGTRELFDQLASALEAATT